MGNVGIINVNSDYLMAIWNTLWAFGLFSGQTYGIFPRIGC
jgi:hypothetical protein